VSRLRAGRPMFDSHQGAGNGCFLFAIMSRHGLELTLPLIQWVPGALSPGVNWSGLECGLVGA
jgi:hypothetical protein